MMALSSIGQQHVSASPDVFGAGGLVRIPGGADELAQGEQHPGPVSGALTRPRRDLDEAVQQAGEYTTGLTTRLADECGHELLGPVDRQLLRRVRQRLPEMRT